MDITQAIELVDRTLYPLMIPEYQQEPAVGRSLCEVLPWDDALTYGERMDAVTDFGEPDEVPFGVELPDRSFGSGYQVWARTRKIGHKVTIARELFVAEAANGRLAGRIEGLFRGQGARFVQQQEKHIAGYVQKGTLTAGSAKYFDQTFAGEAPTNTLVNYDGVPLFDTAHPLKHSGTTPSNHTVTAALSQSTLEAALTLMETTSALDERGEPVVNHMDTLIVPSGGLEFTAQVLLEPALKPGPAYNDLNTPVGRLTPVAWRYLTDDADAWYLFRLNSGKRTLRLRDSGEPRVRTYEDPKTGSIIIEAYKYYSLTSQDWRGAFAANKAAS